MKDDYTAQSIRDYLEPNRNKYFASLAVGRPEGWSTDQRTKDLWCISQWMMEELIKLKCDDVNRRQVQWFFNREARATEDLFALAAVAMNSFLHGTIDTWKNGTTEWFDNKKNSIKEAVK